MYRLINKFRRSISAQYNALVSDGYTVTGIGWLEPGGVSE